jgi:hypothetical protein
MLRLLNLPENFRKNLFRGKRKTAERRLREILSGRKPSLAR